MSDLTTQAGFDKYAAWLRFLNRAARYPERLQALFTCPGLDGLPPSYQANVTFDVATTITQLVSTVGISTVMASFGLLPKKDSEGLPHFQVVLSAINALGGRISAYLLGTATWYTPPNSNGETAGDTHPHLRAATAGPVPYFYPAYPDSPPRLAQTVGLVVGLYSGPKPADPVTMMHDKNGSSEGGGPSYHVAHTSPPY
jgi:hypothetical protein